MVTHKQCSQNSTFGAYYNSDRKKYYVLVYFFNSGIKYNRFKYVKLFLYIKNLPTEVLVLFKI